MNMHNPFILVTVFALALTTFASNTNAEIKITASDAAAQDGFGSSVAIDDGKVVIGALNDDNINGINAGAAYVFDATTGNQLHKFIAKYGQDHTRFGTSVSISNRRVVVGSSPDKKHATQYDGSAYFFNANTGYLFKQINSPTSEGNGFGHSVAISDDLAVVGVSGFDYEYPANAAHAIDFFADYGPPIQSIIPNNGQASCVDIDGTNIIVASHGDIFISSYVNIYDLATGQTTELTVNGNNTSAFGRDVAISQNTAIVGEPLIGGNMTTGGNAYIFDLSNDDSPLKLVAEDAHPFDRFGSAVDIDGNYAIVGAPKDSDNNVYGSGSAYLFDITTGKQLAKFTASDAGKYDEFGSTVAISGNTIVIGAQQNDQFGNDAGAAYIYDIAAYIPEPTSLAIFSICAFACTLRRRSK
ncbi:hypothetical protein JD969_08200 [Planctomycetota bacterium]|nr:hypothetical protein JD969_08200 [Planctomycetota bacterium]